MVTIRSPCCRTLGIRLAVRTALCKNGLAKMAPEELKRPRVKTASRQNGPGFVKTAQHETAPL